MTYLITYDIGSNAIRSKIAKRIIAEGYERMQLSVFIGPGNPTANKLFWAWLVETMGAEPEARLNAIALTDQNLRNMIFIGQSDIDIDFILGLKSTMFV